MKKIIPSVKGTRDYYPEDMALRNWLYNSMRKASEAFGFQEFEAPFIETLELYAAKSGEELVKEQSFVFADRGGDLITLRPELTPSLSRMIAQKQNQIVFPARWWSFGPFWRYERPQKGRTREFFQWNVDILGADSPEVDAELIALAVNFFQLLGLSSEKVVILVNDRKLIDQQLSGIGLSSEQKTNVTNLIDRRRKMKADLWQASAFDLGLTQSQFESLELILENPDVWQESEDLVRLFDALQAMDIQEYVEYDANIIRGLQYYTGTVFEAYDKTGFITRSILGGGRYNNLLSDVGGRSLPAAGFAMGDLIITLILEEMNLVPSDLRRSIAQVLVTLFDESLILESYKFANELRGLGIKTAVFPEPAKLGKQLKYADRQGIQTAVVIGPDEIKNQTITIKNLIDGNQVSIKRSEAIYKIKHILTGG